MKPKVYLAGACEVEDTWRARAAKALEKLDFEPINPLRGETLRKAGKIVDTDITPKLLVTRDLYDMNQVRLSGGLFIMNLNTTSEGRKPIGTLMELCWAYVHGVPVVGIVGRDCAIEIRKHPWVEECVTHPCTSLKAALELVEEYFCYDVGEESRVDEDEED
jgi:hypothetical protein